MKKFELCGLKIKSLDDFFVEFAKMLGVENFGKSVQSFDDCLFGGYGLDSPCEIHWLESSESLKYLNHECLAQWCQETLRENEFLDEEGRVEIERTLESAKSHALTMQDLLVKHMNSVFERSGGNTKINLVLK